MEVLGKTKVDEVKVVLIFVGILFFALCSFLFIWVNSELSGDPLWPWLILWLVVNLGVCGFIVWKWFNVFRVVSWNHDRIWATHIITRQEVSIPWDNASILYEKNNEYTVIGPDNKVIHLEYSRWRTVEKKAAQFVHEKWVDSFQNYIDQMREREVCLWKDEDYESSIKRDKLWINGKSLPLSKILSVWKENMEECHDTSHQKYVLRIQGEDYLMVRVDHVHAESFLRYIKECSPSVKIFSSYLYREKIKDASGELTKEEEQFCKKLLKNERIPLVIIALIMILWTCCSHCISSLVSDIFGSSVDIVDTFYYLVMLGCATLISAWANKYYQKKKQRCYVDTL